MAECFAFLLLFYLAYKGGVIEKEMQIDFWW